MVWTSKNCPKSPVSSEELPRSYPDSARETIAQTLCGVDGNGFLCDCAASMRAAYLLRADAVLEVIPHLAQTPIQQALELAVNIIMAGEPGDSRAVSNEAVALAAVVAGDTSEPVMTVIRAALSLPSPEPQCTCAAIVNPNIPHARSCPLSDHKS